MITKNLKRGGYFQELDIVKGFAILLIIFGHSFCLFPIDLKGMLPSFLPGYVAEFNLHLFFIASGFLFSYYDTWKSFLKKKAMRLVIPYLSFCFLSALLKIMFAPFTHSGVMSLYDSFLNILCGHTYWFLYVLFFIMVTCKFVTPIFKAKSYGLAILSIVSWSVYYIFDSLEFKVDSTLSRYFQFLPFFCIGLFLKQKYNVIFDFLKKHPVAMYISILFSLSVFLMINLFEYNYVNTLGVEILLASLGSCFFWLMSITLTFNRNFPLARYAVTLLAFFGKYSLQFYLNHLLIMLGCYYSIYFLHIANPWIGLVVVFSLGILISYIMLLIEKQWKWTRFLCSLK